MSIRIRKCVVIIGESNSNGKHVIRKFMQFFLFKIKVSFLSCIILLENIFFLKWSDASEYFTYLMFRSISRSRITF